MENKPQIAKAILAVMRAVKSIDKTMTVGTGLNAYKGVSDESVKRIIGDAMQENGLCIIPIELVDRTQVDRWEEPSGTYVKQKQSVFASVTTKYLLLHESGESIEVAGYGHGVDSQDKSAGKATTYALKYALLYTFMVPTTKIDDADNHHSEESQTPPQNEKPWLSDRQFAAMKKSISEGNKDAVRKAIANYRIKKSYSEELNNLLQ